MPVTYPRPDQECLLYLDKFKSECVALLDKQPPDEQLRINFAIKKLVDRIHAADPHSQVDYEDALALIMTIFYYSRFHMSPTATGIFSKPKTTKRMKA